MAVIAAAVVAVDQLTKWWAVDVLSDRTIDLVWTLRLRLTFNPGASFSLGGDLGRWIGLAAIGVVVLLVWHGRTVTSRWGAAALGLILGGALGNLTDRVARADDGFLSGEVVDFIDVQWWPVFNVADACIVIGGILLVIVTLMGEGTVEGEGRPGGDGDAPSTADRTDGAD
jgi:signal peptidase II